MTVKLNKGIAEKIQQLQTPSIQQPKPSIITGSNIKVKQMAQKIQTKEVENRQTPTASLPVRSVVKHPAETNSRLNNDQPIHSQVVQRMLIPEIVSSSEHANMFLMQEKMAELVRLPKEELCLTEDLRDLFTNNPLTKNEKRELQETMLTVMNCPQPLLNIIDEYSVPPRAFEPIQAIISAQTAVDEQNIKARQVQEDMLTVMNCPTQILEIVDEYVYSDTQLRADEVKLARAHIELFNQKEIEPEDILQLQEDMLAVMNCPTPILEIVDEYTYQYSKAAELEVNGTIDAGKIRELLFACNALQKKIDFSHFH